MQEKEFEPMSKELKENELEAVTGGLSDQAMTGKDFCDFVDSLQQSKWELAK